LIPCASWAHRTVGMNDFALARIRRVRMVGMEFGLENVTKLVDNALPAFEGAVKKLTGNDEYKFGDITKKAVTDLTGKDPAEYEFGDITKKAVSDFTGKDAADYQFGDITNKVLSNAEQAVSDLKEGYVGNVPRVLWQQAACRHAHMQ
jgi:hypothetical protein